jgi:NAD(P)-dependent dehydrogenase (short-subunit alcohol dehydrogenase family)
MEKLNGKVALITGATSGIGKATAVDFINNGATVIITGRFKNTVDNTTNTLGEKATGIVSDSGRMSDLMQLKEKVQTISPHIDILFVNAGYLKFAPLERIDEAHFDELFDVLVRGTLFTVQQILPLMRDGGSVILNTSVVTEIGLPAASVYSAAKAAVQSFVKTFASDLSGRKIRVNAVSAGSIQTNWTERTGLDKDQVQQFEASILPQIPLGRFGQPVDVAKAVTFLASDDSSFMQGTEIFVNGGFPMIK